MDSYGTEHHLGYWSELDNSVMLVIEAKARGIWENEVEVLDAVEESKRIRNKKFQNQSIAEGEILIKKEKVKIKKKKRFIFF